MTLATKRCEPCEVGTPPLPKEEAARLGKEISEWRLKEKSIEREFKFKNFQEAIDFVNEVAVLAEQENHHPDIRISYNRVRLELMTHKIGGLSNNDFILAAKIEELL